jgi:FkbM family methyltransferase
MDIKLYGTVYGGFYLPEKLDLDKNSIIYCVGAGEDISFDIKLCSQTNGNVYIFDPTPRAIEHYQLIKSCFENKTKPENNKRYGGGDINYIDKIFENQIDINKLHYYNFGIYKESGIYKFYEPTNKEYVSHTMEENMNWSKNYISVEMKNLKTILSELNHTKIDLLKLDIEGVECEVLEELFDLKIYPKYICVDFDAKRKNIKLRQFESIITKIQSLNYKMIKNVNYDISFML